MTADLRSTLRGVALGCAAGFMILQSATALAQVAPPRAVEQPRPEAPTNRSGMPLEGWAVVRFTVLADGSTADARIVDKMPPAVPDRDIRNAVEDWKFEPATADGQPIDWYNNEAVIVFDAETVPPEPTPPFMAAYSEADELLRANEAEDALRDNERLLQTVATRLREIGLAYVQNAAIHIALGDNHAAYEAIRRATDPRVPLLGPEELPIALQYRNVLELQLGDAEATLETFERRSQLGPVGDEDPVGSRVDSIRQVLADEESVIVMTAKVLDEQWRHTPSRRTFSIGNVEGSLDTIHVECDRRAADLEFMPDAEWTLPESWGDCILAVEGKRDTTFRFFELL